MTADLIGCRESTTVLAIYESPFVDRWERNPRTDDGHAHDWERVYYRREGGGGWMGPKVELEPEPVIRCAVCHCPRCGESRCADPCMERRHHDSLHIYLSGRFEPLGGYLRDEPS